MEEISLEEQTLGEIESQADVKTVLEYQKVGGIDLLVKKAYSSVMLGKTVEVVREWDLINPKRNDKNEVIAYSIKQVTKTIVG